jgi:hypothetical protein
MNPRILVDRAGVAEIEASRAVRIRETLALMPLTRPRPSLPPQLTAPRATLAGRAAGPQRNFVFVPVDAGSLRVLQPASVSQ